MVFQSILLIQKRVKLTDTRGSVASAFSNMIRSVIRDNKPQLIVCVVPNTNKDTYDAIKRTCCVEYGIPSQCITSNIINTQNMNKTKSVITKVAVQINCKLGGEIWGVTIPVAKTSSLSVFYSQFNKSFNS